MNETKPKPKSTTTANTQRGHTTQPAVERGPTVVILLYSTTGANNYQPWKKWAIGHFESKYGQLATFIKTGVMYTPPAVEMPSATDLDATNDPFGMKKRALFKRVEKREDLIASMQEKWTSFSSDLWAVCSAPSQAAIKAYVPSSMEADSEAEPLTYVVFERTNNPFELFQLIEATHIGSLIGSAVPDAVNALKRLVYLHQKPEQSTDAYKEQLDNAIISANCTDLPKFSQALLAGLYIAGLDDRRYAQLKSDLNNDEAKGLATRPDTLLGAHNLAIKRTNVFAKTGAGSGADLPASVFIANAATGGRFRGGRGQGRGQGRGAGRGSGKSGANDQKPDTPADGAKKEDICVLCKKPGHWVRECPHRDEASRLLGAALKGTEQKSAKVAISYADVAPNEPDVCVF